MRPKAHAAASLVTGAVEPAARRPLGARVERRRDRRELLERQRRLLRRTQPALFQCTRVHELQAHRALPGVAVHRDCVILAALQFILGEAFTQLHALLWVCLVGIEDLHNQPNETSQTSSR